MEFCHTQTAAKSTKQFGQKFCQSPHKINSKRVKETVKHPFINKQNKKKIFSPHIKNHDIHSMIKKFEDKIKVNETETEDIKLDKAVRNNKKLEELEIMISPIKTNKNKKVNSIKKVLKHERKDDIIKKKKNRVQMLIRKLETDSQTMIKDSQDLDELDKTDNVNRDKKKNEAYAKQSQITSFFRKKND